MSDPDYDELVARLTDPDVPLPEPRHVLTGGDAAAAGREFLISQYGGEEALERAVRRGRPRDGTPGGTSPTVRGRISNSDFAAFKRLEHATGKNQSELVREAVRLLLAENRIGA